MQGSSPMQAGKIAGGVHNVVLVHGSYADGSSWSDVVERLQAAGMKRRFVAGARNHRSGVPEFRGVELRNASSRSEQECRVMRYSAPDA
jgi:hypothetical protein